MKTFKGLYFSHSIQKIRFCCKIVMGDHRNFYFFENLLSYYRVSKKSAFLWFLEPEKIFLGPEIFWLKMTDRRVIYAINRLHAFPKHENASLTLIQGIDSMYWRENRKNFYFFPESIHLGVILCGESIAYIF